MGAVVCGAEVRDGVVVNGREKCSPTSSLPPSLPLSLYSYPHPHPLSLTNPSLANLNPPLLPPRTVAEPLVEAFDVPDFILRAPIGLHHSREANLFDEYLAAVGFGVGQHVHAHPAHSAHH